MKDPFEFRSGQQNAPPTTKEKSAVQRAVTKLLDVLAPERTTTRTERAPTPIEQHRTPSGCVLQAATAALSVSWFPDAPTDTSLGELQVLLWRGVVRRRGAVVVREKPTVVRELTLRPVEQSLGGFAWRDEGAGTVYDLDALANNCLALLEKQVAVNDAAGSATPPTSRRRN